MKMKSLVIRHYQEIVDNAAKHARNLPRPPEGWLKTTRKALNMSGAQLARRIGVTRARISHAEKDELKGAVSLQTLQQIANAMGCRVIYAIVPNSGRTEDLIASRAIEKAREIVEYAGKHMALEDQSLPRHRLSSEVKRLQQQFISELPSDLWDSK